MKKISGIYKIVNLVNGKYYIGSSKDIFTKPHGRWPQHIAHLKSKVHYNQHLQSAWNKYGKDNFDIKVLEIVEESMLLQVEQKYLNIAKSEQNKCYNLSFIAGRPEWTKELKEKRSKQITGSNNPNFGNGEKIAGKNNPSYCTILYSFYNTVTNETFVGTRFEFIQKYTNLTQCGVSDIIYKRQKSHRNWILK